MIILHISRNTWKSCFT